MTRTRFYLCVLACLLVFIVNAEADESADSRLPPSLLTTVEAIGGSSGVPDGFGYSYSFRRPVRGQAESFLLQSYQLGAMVPAWQTATDGLFITSSVKALEFKPAPS